MEKPKDSIKKLRTNKHENYKALIKEVKQTNGRTSHIHGLED